MAEDRFRLTSCISKRYASLEIVCCNCGHKKVADFMKVREMFPTPIALDKLHYRLRCSRCGVRRARFTVIRRPER